MINLRIRSAMPRFVRGQSPELRRMPAALIPLMHEYGNLMELALLKATANFVDPVSHPIHNEDTNSFESLFLRRLISLPPEKQQFAALNFQSQVGRLELLRQTRFRSLNEHGILDTLFNSSSIFEMATPLLQEKARLFVQRMGLSGSTPIEIPVLGNTTTLPPLSVTLRIHKVRCEDETDPEGGDDEISLGALATAPNGTTTRLGPYTIREDFDDEEEELYNPAWNFHTFEVQGLNDSSPYPKYCSCTFILTEIDNGGFPQWLQELCEKLQAILRKSISEALTPYLGPLISEAVAFVVDWLIGKLLDLIKEIWEDDKFLPHNASLSFPSRFTDFDGSRHSQIYTAWIQGLGGTYTIDYSWELHGEIRSSRNPQEGAVTHTPEGPAGAIVFKDTHFGGDRKFLPIGNHALGGGYHYAGGWRRTSPFNDEIDSILVGEGFVAKLYKTTDFTGEFIEVYHDTPIAYFDDLWRDQISSITVDSLGSFI